MMTVTSPREAREGDTALSSLSPDAMLLMPKRHEARVRSVGCGSGGGRVSVVGSGCVSGVSAELDVIQTSG